MSANWIQLLELQVTLEAMGLEVPTPLSRSLELIELAREHADSPDPSGLLELKDKDLPAVIQELAVRRHASMRLTDGGHGLHIGAEAFVERILVEAHSACIPHMEALVEQLRPRFDAAAAVLHTAAQDFRFTSDTTSDHVVLVDTPGAVEAWRAIPAALDEINPIAGLRQRISETFDLSPTLAEKRKSIAFHSALEVDDGMVDYSVCFAAADNWALGGNYYRAARPNMRGSLDWLALARGGLRLNTPTEVRAKVYERQTGKRT